MTLLLLNQNFDLSPLRILLVDDEQEMLDVLKERLEFYHAQVTACQSGLAAYDLIASRAFNLVILDIAMPKVTGWDLIRAIRSHPDPLVNQLPVIALTAHFVDPNDKEALLQAGYDRYFRKLPDRVAFFTCLDTYAREIAPK